MAETPLTRNLRADDQPVSLQEYERSGGYEGLRRALTRMTPGEVIEEVKRAQLLGRGGAAFPAGLKWAAVPKPEDDPGPRHVVANADEMEPGTFKDRRLCEGDPHGLIEGLAIAGYAIQAATGFIFLRGEYHRARERLKRALGEAREAGYLGPDILHSGYSLEVHLHVGAGRYMCGEADALLNVLEGRRAVPRWKPPHPTLSGLWGRPTVVNNVETLCNVPHVIARGAEWFRSLSPEGGTKLYGVTGQVNRPGLWELPLGVPLRELLECHAGGMREGRRFRGVLPGGASTDFLVQEHLDVKLDFASAKAAGSRLGTGTAIVLDDRTCPVGFVHCLERFFARESCGWCTPCRDGLPWTEQTLRAIEEGRGQPGDLERLEADVELMKPGHTFCALAPGAMAPLQSALRYFRHDFERHLTEGRCPWG